MEAKMNLVFYICGVVIAYWTIKYIFRERENGF